MSELELIAKVSKLPPKLKEEVSNFVDALIAQHLTKTPSKTALKFGMMKGTFIMEEDFDEPLEDFRNYMQ